MAYFSIRVPKDTLWSPPAASALIRSIFSDEKAGIGIIRFDIFGSHQGIEFLIRLNDQIDVPYLQALVRAFYPQADVIALCRKRIDAARNLYKDGEIEREEYMHIRDTNEQEIAHW